MEEHLETSPSSHMIMASYVTFEAESKDLIVRDTREIVAVQAVQNSQYIVVQAVQNSQLSNDFVKERLIERSELMDHVISRTCLTTSACR